jgi:pantetheine-phosphate adenylyltransferase
MAPDPTRAVLPGSYDPVTNGHLDVIARAARLFEHVIVAVVNLPVRKGKTLFEAEQRVGFIEGAVADLGLGNVSVKPFSNLVVEFAVENNARAIVKGLRAISDFEYEFEMNQLNRMQAPDVESVYLMSSPMYSFLSSSGVRELATFGGNIDDLVPASVAKALKERLGR